MAQSITTQTKSLLKAKVFVGSLISAVLLATSSVAFGKVIVRDVTLQNTFLDRSALSVRIVGELSKSCLDTDNIQFSLNHAPVLTTNKEINIYVEERTADEDLGMCGDLSKPFVKDMYLGLLDPGFYMLRIFEDNTPILSRGFSVPFDVKTAPLGIDFNQTLGDSREQQMGQKS